MPPCAPRMVMLQLDHPLRLYSPPSPLSDNNCTLCPSRCPSASTVTEMGQPVLGMVWCITGAPLCCDRVSLFPSKPAQLRHPDTVLALEYIPQERHLCAGCQDSLIQVWSATTFTCIKVLEGHTRAVLSLHAPKAKSGEGLPSPSLFGLCTCRVSHMHAFSA